MPKGKGYHIIFEDDSILVVNKAPGISVIPGRKQGPELPLVDLIKNAGFDDIRLVHRIDRDTSGVILFARGIENQRLLSEAFSSGMVKKEYLAITEGQLVSSEWKIIDAPIFKKENQIKVKIHPKGRPARTKYRTIKSFRQATLAELQILTGKTHQIRVHLAHIGYPLLIDPLYGNRSEVFLSEWMGKKYRPKKNEERPLVSRQTLHANRISFQHPRSGKQVQFIAEPPKDWRAVMNQLNRLNPESD